MDYFDLGRFSRSVSTQNDTAQTWFNRGLVWCYAFNHEEAAECFRKAQHEDADCIMANWGLAYSLGPNYNKPWDMFDSDEMERNMCEARSALKAAEDNATSSNSTELERALIHAIKYRYQDNDKDRSTWSADYAREMEEVYGKFGDDPDVATLHADALMNLTPWGLWSLKTGEPAEGARTLEAKAVLDRAIAQEGGDRHPGLLHLYIHLMEMSPTPEKGLSAADCLRGLVPDAGHLHHMPTHLDVLCGDYRSVVAYNSEAIRADERWLAKAGALNFYTVYRMHNYHFRIYGAMFTGQSRIALETAAQLEACVPEDLLRTRSPPMADWLEGFLSMRLHVLIRFGRWSDILDLVLPQDQELYCVTIAMTHYARCVALANTNKVDEAENERKLFHDAVDRVRDSRTLFNNTCKDILAIAGAMLEGELEYRLESVEAAFEHLRNAVDLSDNLPYDEPWGWMQPPRHAYGALLLEQGRIEEAAAVYSADLGYDDTLPRALQHPNNIWALHGYLECLTQLERDAEARIVRKQLTLSAATADVPINSSCYCRTKGLNQTLNGDGTGVPPWRRFNLENS